MSSKEFLLDNVNEFIKEAREAALNKSYNSSVTLYFKAIAVLCDIFILEKEKQIPKSHVERFQILKEKYPKLYKIIDKLFPLYQNSYRIKLNKKYVEIFENDIKQIIEITKTKISN